MNEELLDLIKEKIQTLLEASEEMQKLFFNGDNEDINRAYFIIEIARSINDLLYRVEDLSHDGDKWDYDPNYKRMEQIKQIMKLSAFVRTKPITSDSCRILSNASAAINALSRPLCED